jgi:hypothetical protein
LVNLHLPFVHHCNQSLFLHQLKPFPTIVSTNARVFLFWHSKVVVRSRVLVLLHLPFVHHFSRSLFLHQLKSFPRIVSGIARIFLVWHSRRAREFPLSTTLSLLVVRHWLLSRFLHRFDELNESPCSNPVKNECQRWEIESHKSFPRRKMKTVIGDVFWNRKGRLSENENVSETGWIFAWGTFL